MAASSPGASLLPGLDPSIVVHLPVVSLLSSEAKYSCHAPMGDPRETPIAPGVRRVAMVQGPALASTSSSWLYPCVFAFLILGVGSGLLI